MSNRGQNPLSQTAIIAIISALLYISGFFGGHPSQHDPSEAPAFEIIADEPGVVRSTRVAVHREPNSREVIAHLTKGDALTIVGKAPGWYRVRLANGQIGYVNTFAVILGSPSKYGDLDGKYDVVAYYVTDSVRPSRPSLEENIELISTVVPWMWAVTPTGELRTAFNVRDVSQALQFAGDHEKTTLALVHNTGPVSGGGENFNGDLAHQILSDPNTRQKTIDNLVEKLTEWGLSGVHIDFEWVRPSDRQNLTLFLQELKAAFEPHDLLVTIAVPAKTHDSYTDSWSGAYDYAAIARHVDQMMVMTYDEHWSGGHPGPVASIGWVERVVRFALAAGVPADKLVLGVPGYGYDWPASGNARAVTHRQAIEQASRHGVPIQ